MPGQCLMKLDVWLAGPCHRPQVLQDPNSWGVDDGDFVVFYLLGKNDFGETWWYREWLHQIWIFLTLGTLAPPKTHPGQPKKDVLFLCIRNCPDHRCDNLHLGHHQSREQKWLFDADDGMFVRNSNSKALLTWNSFLRNLFLLRYCAFNPKCFPKCFPKTCNWAGRHLLLQVHREEVPCIDLEIPRLEMYSDAYCTESFFGLIMFNFLKCLSLVMFQSFAVPANSPRWQKYWDEQPYTQLNILGGWYLLLVFLS